MDLFLSKLLPLLIYPIGLSCLLLGGAIVAILKRRSRLAILCIALAAGLLLTTSSPRFSAWIVRSLEQQYLPGEVPTAEAIVLLGGATNSQLAPRPWVEISDEGDRVLYSAKLYREGKAPLIIPTGGRIDWKGPGSSEAEDMATLLETMGVPRSAVVLEPKALNTYENAINVKAILDERKINRFLLVTSATHMPRSMMIFRKLGLDPIATPTDYQKSDRESQFKSPEAFLLSYLPDAEYLRDTNRAIKEYVGMLIYRLKGWV
jgi:uncharacterized SAM-binding protein YcdF (DUF218 family)